MGFVVLSVFEGLCFAEMVLIFCAFNRDASSVLTSGNQLENFFFFSSYLMLCVTSHAFHMVENKNQTLLIQH